LDWEEADLSGIYDATFQAMNLSRPLLKAVEALGFVAPTPVQVRKYFYKIY